MNQILQLIIRNLILAGFLLATILVSIVFYALFMAWYSPPRHNSTNIEMFREGKGMYQEDGDLGATLIPEGYGRISSNGIIYEIFHGPYGNRINSPQDKSRFDAELIMLGCSQAWGQGVVFDQLASTLAAKALGVNSLNLSVPGTGTVYAAKRLEKVPELKPKYVVYLFFEEHLYRNIRMCAPVNNPLCIKTVTAVSNSSGKYSFRQPTYNVENFFGGVYVLMQRWYLEQYEGSNKLSYWKDVFWTLLDIYGKLQKMLFDNPDIKNARHRNDIVAAFDFALGYINKYTKERNAELIVIYLPNYSYPNQLTPLPEDLRQVINHYAAKIIDMAEPFNKTIGLENKNHGTYLFAIPNDGHLNELGHSMIAKELVSLIKN